MGLHEIVYNSKIFVHIIAILIRLYNKLDDIFMQWWNFNRSVSDDRINLNVYD